ncbi:hypothetical protein IEQ34_019520 [Dendrobium chrysotoxum]|uniref:Uncharacterized protein n=1 Tax=Dendrobium chrysotoxum TaxID=161865 RepID=A0AAV7G727_DENCH|nr:hypothetical protein IEQ34_019520 [Dendrobium chrysotoxum]
MPRKTNFRPDYDEDYNDDYGDYDDYVGYDDNEHGLSTKGDAAAATVGYRKLVADATIGHLLLAATTTIVGLHCLDAATIANFHQPAYCRHHRHLSPCWWQPLSITAAFHLCCLVCTATIATTTAGRLASRHLHHPHHSHCWPLN